MMLSEKQEDDIAAPLTYAHAKAQAHLLILSGRSRMKPRTSGVIRAARLSLVIKADFYPGV